MLNSMSGQSAGTCGWSCSGRPAAFRLVWPGSNRPIRVSMPARSAAVLLFAISVILFCRGFFSISVPKAASSDGLRDGDFCNGNAAKPFDKLVLMVIDAWSWDFIASRKHDLPFIWESIEEAKADAFIANVQTPTVTLPRIKAIVSGVVPSFADVLFNFFSSDYVADNFVGILKEKEKRIVFYGDDTWMNMFSNAFEERSEGTVSFFVRDYTELVSVFMLMTT
ncbi:hypothetical protein L596_018719 [Steinernema carpocapsae]|uniref:Uncharacterized protein n=1 Tax=Steinernema carpocapsae TaxID=34508 RepID=A0A4U5N5Y3_STECR|nr:hypothetical protein L596_018719 [Steinernema carpocapsae]